MEDRSTQRADLLLVQRGLAASRERAQALIAAGLAYANGVPIQKPAQKVPADALLEVRGEWCPYVSRGGFKLARALESFQISPQGRVALDVGASTGGFTDVLLQNGARKVYALDVGQGQLDGRLASDTRVVQMDKVNARALRRDMFPEPPDLAVMDVSFISILKILPALREVLAGGELIALVKPQFEAGRQLQGKKGVITRPTVHEQVLRQIAAQAPALGWQVRAYDYSPIAGTQGNLEFLAHLVTADSVVTCPDGRYIRELVQSAHRFLRHSGDRSTPER